MLSKNSTLALFSATALEKFLRWTFLPIFIFCCETSFSQTYNAVDWGTYFNDSEHYPSYNYQDADVINQVAVDRKDPESIYVVGQTSAPPASTVQVCGANSIILHDDDDGFLAKYNRCGELVWSTYIGNNIFCVAVDNENGKTIIYVGGKAYAGQAFSCDGGGSVFQPTATDANNCFVAKYLDDDSVPILMRWTFFGGTGAGGTNEAIYGIDVSKHKVFTTGITQSTNLSAGAQHAGDTTYGGGDDDGFVAVFDSLLSNLVFFTYIGGEGDDRCHGIKVSTGIAGPSATVPDAFYVSGTTSSTVSIASGSGFDQTFNGVNDAFICKWVDRGNNSAFRKLWGTYIGGTANEHGRKLVVDKKGNVFFTGFTGSTDFPTTAFAYDTTYGEPGWNNTQNDAFIMKLSTKGALMWSTYFGGSSNEESDGIVLLINQGVRYVAITGVTASRSLTFDVVNPLQPHLNGADTGANIYDAFIAVFKDVNSGQQQQLFFSTYLGGSADEREGIGNYRPSLALGPHNVLYYGGVTRSSDINSVMGNSFQDLGAPYNAGGVDGFVARLIATNNYNQYACDSVYKLQATMESSGLGEFTLYPNPAATNLTVQYNSAKDSHERLAIYDFMGKIIFTREIDSKAGSNKVILNLHDLTAGVYLVEINNGSSNSRKMFVVQ